MWSRYQKVSAARPEEYLVNLAEETLNLEFLHDVLTTSVGNYANQGNESDIGETEEELDSDTEGERLETSPEDVPISNVPNDRVSGEIKAQKYLEGIVWCLVRWKPNFERVYAARVASSYLFLRPVGNVRERDLSR